MVLSKFVKSGNVMKLYVLEKTHSILFQCEEVEKAEGEEVDKDLHFDYYYLLNSYNDEQLLLHIVTFVHNCYLVNLNQKTFNWI